MYYWMPFTIAAFWAITIISVIYCILFILISTMLFIFLGQGGKKRRRGERLRGRRKKKRR